MQRIMVAFVIVGACFLFGCVSKQWYRADATPEGFELDKQQCLYDAQRVTVGTYGFEMPMLVQQCMKAKGYVPID